jgi:hypothetical protein
MPWRNTVSPASTSSPDNPDQRDILARPRLPLAQFPGTAEQDAFDLELLDRALRYELQPKRGELFLARLAMPFWQARRRWP